eukprot:g49538.t1
MASGSRNLEHGQNALPRVGDTEGLGLVETLTEGVGISEILIALGLAEDVKLTEAAALTEGDSEIFLLADTGDRLVEGVWLTEAVGLAEDTAVGRRARAAAAGQSIFFAPKEQCR